MSSRLPFIIASVVAAAFAVLAAGCGGGSPAGAGVASSTTAATTTAQNGALAFAHCMRSHGLPNWPDPTSGGEFDKSKLRQLAYSVSQVRAVEDGPCSHLLQAPAPGPAITAADRADYLNAAVCMRSHGVADFPDPTFRTGGVQTNIPSSVNQDSSSFRSAAATCTKLIPAGLPYSHASGS